MNDHDPMEEELRRLRPTSAPEDFDARLIAIAALASRPPGGRAGLAGWFVELLKPRRLVWGTVPIAALLMAIFFLRQRPTPVVAPPTHTACDFVPDSITLSQEVVARYDGAIVQSPDGEIVRLTGFERVDCIILKDSRGGGMLERREPRREIIPVHLDIY